jgi:hypothetical protein
LEKKQCLQESVKSLDKIFKNILVCTEPIIISVLQESMKLKLSINSVMGFQIVGHPFVFLFKRGKRAIKADSKTDVQHPTLVHIKWPLLSLNLPKELW